jgi:hypothetical protein
MQKHFFTVFILCSGSYSFGIFQFLLDGAGIPEKMVELLYDEVQH